MLTDRDLNKLVIGLFIITIISMLVMTVNLLAIDAEIKALNESCPGVFMPRNITPANYTDGWDFNLSGSLGALSNADKALKEPKGEGGNG